MRTGALKPSTFKNPVGKKKGGEESYRLSRCQVARTRKGGMKGEGKTETSERSCYIQSWKGNVRLEVNRKGVCAHT